MPRLSHRAGRPQFFDRARPSLTREDPADFLTRPHGGAGPKEIELRGDSMRLHRASGISATSADLRGLLGQDSRVRRYPLVAARSVYNLPPISTAATGETHAFGH